MAEYKILVELEIDVPDSCQWIAIDADGIVGLSENEPEAGDTYWRNNRLENNAIKNWKDLKIKLEK